MSKKITVICALCILFSFISVFDFFKDSPARAADPNQNRYHLGVQIQSMTPEMRQGLGIGNIEGVLICAVEANSPAKAYGLMAQDIIVSIDNIPVSTAEQVTRLIQYSPGTVSIGVLRSGRMSIIPVQLALGAPQAPTGPSVAGQPDLNNNIQQGKDFFKKFFPPQDNSFAPQNSAAYPRSLYELVINKVSLEPSTVTPGSRFNIRVEYQIKCDTNIAGVAPALNLDYTYAILNGGKVIFEKAARQAVPTARKNVSIKELVATKKPGTYQVKVALESNDLKAEKSATLVVRNSGKK